MTKGQRVVGEVQRGAARIQVVEDVLQLHGASGIIDRQRVNQC